MVRIMCGQTETLEQMARRMCRAYVLKGCKNCPLDGYGVCASAAMLPESYPLKVQIIRDWAAAHPPKEAPNAD